jgi:ribA/ribD-fused uncharacterized protein
MNIHHSMADGKYVLNPKTSRKILIGGPTYQKLVREGIQFPENTSSDTVIGFWKPEGENGYLSQWYMSPFILDGITYSCAEQAMMAAKAKTFNDTATLKKILMTNSPSQMKKLGKQVAGFDPAVWDKVKYSIVVKNNIEKFSQNHELLDKLLDTGEQILAELSPYDKVWGVGTKSKNQALWKGENLLGKSLAEVRNILRNNLDD